MNINTNTLIRGAGIAGLTTAYWLHNFGFNPTIRPLAKVSRN
jgi:2-polyprenyl-6-methoxyphenol hydroxylase-like FAD-dependent oxidoreductase